MHDDEVEEADRTPQEPLRMSRFEKSRQEALEVVQGRLRPAEDVVAILPFASTPKRPSRSVGKTRDGIYTSYRRYRPLVVTTLRLFVLEGARTPHPRGGVLADFPLKDVGIVEVIPGRFKQNRVLLALPGNGTVPFDVGGYELEDLGRLRAALERP